MPQSPTRRRATPTLRRDAEALHVAVSNLVRVYQYRDRDTICCHDISVTQCHALEMLIERGPSRSQALADALMLDKSTTTRVVDALVRKGYVERRADPDDARALSLQVTDQGRALCARINAELVEQHVELMRDLEPGALAGATAVIERLARAAQSRFVAGPTAGNACAPACGSDSGGCD